MITKRNMSDEVILISNRKISQLYKAIKDRVDKKYIERILQKEGDINLQFFKNSNINQIDTNSNLLHLTFSESNLKTFNLLLNHNADFTIKNNEGHTIIHRAIQDKYETSRTKFQNSFVDAILSAHVRFRNFSNPTCYNQLSHFHAACMIDHYKAVRFFLENSTPVDFKVNNDSIIFAGFSPIHFAARYSCLRAMKILLEYGADLHLKNSEGMTALNILIERKMNGLESDIEDENDKMIELLINHDIAINKNYTISDNFNLSYLHAACLLKNTTLLEKLLEKELNINQHINSNSPIYSGYTPLHFAAKFNINSLKLLINRGSDISSKDVNGITPFDLCLQRYNTKDIHSIISSKHEWKNIVMLDNKTRLLDLVFALATADETSEFLEIRELFAHVSVPLDSSLWPGFTILHLVVIFSENFEDYWDDDVKKIEVCLKRGGDILKVDGNGMTPLHLAFYLQKRRVVEFLLQYQVKTENPSDKNGLSHFHIACAARDDKAVENFLSDNVDVNAPVNATLKWNVLCSNGVSEKSRYFFITPGSTALHINVASGNTMITKMLLYKGADVYAKDVNGFTPIHRLLTSRTSFFYERIQDLLFNVDDLKDSITNGGLTHLHVASYLDNAEAIKKLLASGANINARISYNKATEDTSGIDWFFDPYGDPFKEPLSILSRYEGFTPLNFAMQQQHFNAKKLLIEKGADLFVSVKGSAPIYEILFYYSSTLLPILAKNVDWQNRLGEKLGLTMLHVACHAIKLDVIKDLSNSGVNVNAQVNFDSPIWPGCTPLHLAIRAAAIYGSDERGDSMKIFQMLLNNGADVTLMNSEEDTPLHMVDVKSDVSFADSSYVDLLFNTVKDFSVNPTNSQGLSFFHIACIKKDVEKVQKYLKSGVDVNQSVSYFAARYAGCSPLHLAAGYQSKSLDDIALQLQTVDLLLKYRADVHTKDSYDNTPLHAAATKGISRDEIFEMIIRNGGDVHTENIFGETPFEILAKSGNATWQEVNCLLKYGCHLNSYNPVTQEGYVPKFFISPKTRKDRDSASVIVNKLINSDSITEVDSEGRTILHNLVSVIASDDNRAWHRDDLIGRLMERGCKINHRDVTGRTALHTATLFRNSFGIRQLLKNGADINLTDANGKTAFSYVFEKNVSAVPEHLIELFVMHVHKMELCGLYVNELNNQLKEKAIKEHRFQFDRFDEHVERTKRIKISNLLTLHDFCFNKNAKMAYPNMSHEQRQEVDTFFESNNEKNLREMDYVYRLKHKKASEKLRLISPALISFSDLIKYQLPDLCCRIILGYLTSTDLENVIALMA